MLRNLLNLLIVGAGLSGPAQGETPEGSRPLWRGSNRTGITHEAVLRSNQSENQPGKKTRGPRPPFVPTPQDVVEKMLELAEVKKTDTVVDLGCGDGRIAITAAQKFGCKALGYDLDRECLRRARENVKRSDLEDRVQVIEEDIFNVGRQLGNPFSGSHAVSCGDSLIFSMKNRKEFW